MENSRSWWEGLSRQELDAAIAARADVWAKKAVGPLDAVGERLRDSWEPRHKLMADLRSPLR